MMKKITYLIIAFITLNQINVLAGGCPNLDPPTGDALQTFCTSSITFNDIEVVLEPGTEVRWYFSATGGAPLDTEFFTPQNGGTYYAGSIDLASSCNSNTRLEVQVSITPLDPPVLLNDPSDLVDVCQNSELIVEFAVNPGFEVNWYSGSSVTFVGNSRQVSTFSLSPGQLITVAADSSGCVGDKIQFNYNVIEGPQFDSIIDGNGFDFVGSSTSVCKDETLEFTPYGNFDDFTFFYSDSTSSFGNESFNLNIIANDNTTGCSTTNVRNISIINIPQTIVASASSTSIAPGFGGPGVYRWFDCETDQLLQENYSGTNFVPESSGSYYVVIDVDFCSRTSACVDFINCGEFSITADIIFNENTATVANVTGGTAPYSYQWVGPNGFVNTDNLETITDLENGQYQIIVTDANGCQFSKEEILDYQPTSINNLLANSVKLYPNPTNNVLNIELEAISAVEVFNITGKKILETEANITHQINVSAFAQGLYFVKVGEQTMKFAKH